MSRGASFPVGKVDFIQVYPVTFSEFLSEAEPGLFSYIEQLDKLEPLPDIFFNPLCEVLKMYYISGGMPEAVVSLLERRDMEGTQEVLQNILNAYLLDFSKHVENRDIPKINFIWRSLPSQLARENKKFLYQSVRPGARSREYEDALLWLINAGLAIRVSCAAKPSMPLSAYDDLTAFKIYLPDTGLLRRLSLLDPVAVTEGNRLFTEFKGSLTENSSRLTLSPLLPLLLLPRASFHVLIHRYQRNIHQHNDHHPYERLHEVTAPARHPMAALHHTVAAVVSPWMSVPCLKMIPAPRKPIPVTTCPIILVTSITVPLVSMML
jgi:hypothetical protein